MMADAGMRSAPGLVRLDVDAELPSPALYLAFHRELRTVPRVRLVIEARGARGARRGAARWAPLASDTG